MNTHINTTRVRVRYAETDKMGVVYYANYLVWFEVGRTEWLRQTGWSYRDMELDSGVQLPVIEVHCDYRQPARYDDELNITTRGTQTVLPFVPAKAIATRTPCPVLTFAAGTKRTILWRVVALAFDTWRLGLRESFGGCLFGVRFSRFHGFGGELILEKDNHPPAVRNPSVHLGD